VLYVCFDLCFMCFVDLRRSLVLLRVRVFMVMLVGVCLVAAR